MIFLPRRKTARIQRVTIEGFRSLQRIENLELPQLAVLIGSNGAGKSNFIKFFEMLSAMLRRQGLQEFVATHGFGDDQFFMGARKTPRIHAELQLKNVDEEILVYRFGIAHVTARDTVMLIDEAFRHKLPMSPKMSPWLLLEAPSKEAQLPELAEPYAKAIVLTLRRCDHYQFHDTSANAPIHNAWDVTDNAILRSDGGNLAAILHTLYETDRPRYDVIVQQIRRVLPTFDDFTLEPIGGKVLLRWKGKYGDKTFGTHLTSDGSLRLFCLLTLLNMPSEQLPDILFLDEPELGLHPHAITLMAEMLKRVSQSHQVFIATQSPYLVDCFELENIIVADMKEGATSLRNLPRSEYQLWLDNDYLLSDLWLQSPIGEAK